MEKSETGTHIEKEKNRAYSAKPEQTWVETGTE